MGVKVGPYRLSWLNNVKENRKYPNKKETQPVNQIKVEKE